ncbi:MAG: hypothetical protein PHS95_02840 [Candidatus Pacebacteria bacterium]|nr:hypothetical protein [Candidatus Paceibacterota bacterium]
MSKVNTATEYTIWFLLICSILLFNFVVLTVAFSSIEALVPCSVLLLAFDSLIFSLFKEQGCFKRRPMNAS